MKKNAWWIIAILTAFLIPTLIFASKWGSITTKLETCETYIKTETNNNIELHKISNTDRKEMAEKWEKGQKEIMDALTIVGTRLTRIETKLEK